MKLRKINQYQGDLSHGLKSPTSNRLFLLSLLREKRWDPTGVQCSICSYGRDLP